jgi:fructose-1-phosphate kinase PfkB-like protein
VPPDFYAGLTRLLQEQGAKVILDTSGAPFDLGLGARPYLIKPNAEEAGAATGFDASTAAGAASAVIALLDRGAEVVALSLGAGGLLLGCECARIYARPPAVRAPNPVGAGDSLVAGLIWAMAQGLGWEAVARWGVAAGTAAAMREGVSVGAFDEVAALTHRVELLPWPDQALSA